MTTMAVIAFVTSTSAVTTNFNNVNVNPPCNSLTGTWNAAPGSSDRFVRIVSDVSGNGNLTAAWWLPNPTTNVSGTVGGSDNRQFRLPGLAAIVSTSPYMAKDKSGPAPVCSYLKFGADGWCLDPWCPEGPPPPAPSPPPPPTPNDPFTPMPNFVVPNAAAQGAFYPGGEPANFFMNNTGASGWVIHLSGGGWRFVNDGHDDNIVADGVSQTTPTYGADGRCYSGCDGILSNDPIMNPLFHTWNKVWIPITGTSFTGDVDKGPPYTRGKRVQIAVIQDLLDSYGMKGATNIILTGGSSGGLATYLTCDRVGAQIKAANPTARYTCLPDAGYFLHHNDINGGNSTSESFKRSYYGWNSTGGTNQACVAALKPTGDDWKCIFAEYVAPYIKSEMFVMQNLYDSWQINNILKIGCSGYNQPMTSCDTTQMSALEHYGSDMRAALAPITTNINIGMFTPSCIAHCQSVANEHPIALWYWPDRWSIVEANNQSIYPMSAFNAWYSGTDKGNTSKHVQQCAWSPETCNKLCPDWT
eukprot:m.28756 g.28756  ORF g.28756 m.28756 type:complete len:529 (-) comp15978_c0_seq1:92-1678(-)